MGRRTFASNAGKSDVSVVESWAPEEGAERLVAKNAAPETTRTVAAKASATRLHGPRVCGKGGRRIVIMQVAQSLVNRSATAGPINDNKNIRVNGDMLDIP